MITIYSATWCAFCHATKQYLDKLGVEYTDKDIDDDMAAANEAMAKSGQRAIPVIDIDGTIFVGFNRPAVDAALAARK
jgi:glutaredoxin-like YruB-family protein